MFVKGTSHPLYRSLDAETLMHQYWQTGDKRIFAELFHRFAPVIFKVCHRHIPEEDLCRDMVMATFEKCLSSPPSPNLQSVKRWLTVVARNACIDYLRSQHQYTEYCRTLADLQNHLIYAQEPEENYPAHLWLNQVLQQLKAEQRICIELFFFQQKTYEQIAQSTSFSLTEIKSHLQNGKRRLRLLLLEFQNTDSAIT